MGRGLACYIEWTGGDLSETVRIEADSNGIVTLFSGTQNMGQGLETVFTQLLSEKLQIPMKTVNIVLGDTKLVKMSQQAAKDAKSDPNITKITTAKGQDLKEDEYEAEEDTISTSHITLVAKEVHKALIDALQETGHEVSEDKISSLNPQTFTVSVRFKDNTQSDYSFEVCK